MKRILFIVICFLSSVFAQDEGLYAPAPPADAAFIRIIHALESAPAVNVSVGDTAYGEISFAQSSPYRVVIQGTRTISAGETSQDIEVVAGKFYTLAVTGGGILIIEDASSSNRAKALLSLYNLSNLAMVDLKTADGKTEVFTGVTPGTQNSIEVNGITVDLAVVSDGADIQAFPGTKLERGAAYSVIVLNASTAIWVPSETTTE